MNFRGRARLLMLIGLVHGLAGGCDDPARDAQMGAASSGPGGRLADAAVSSPGGSTPLPGGAPASPGGVTPTPGGGADAGNAVASDASMSRDGAAAPAGGNA